MKNFTFSRKPLPVNETQATPLKQGTPTAIPVPVQHDKKGTPVRAIGLFANNYTNTGGVIIGSGTSLEQRRNIVRRR